MALYPQPRSALIPMLHLAQEQDGYLAADAMGHIGELIGLTAAEVRGTASFYDMLHLHPVGKYVLSICTNIACLLNGGYELLEHAEESLGVKSGGTTSDAMFTVEEFECLALCGNAPCLTANWRFFGDLTPDKFDTLIDDLRTGRLDADVPQHGTLCRVRRTVGLVAAGPPKTPAPAAPAPAASTAPPAAAAPVSTPSPVQEGTSPVPEEPAPPVSQPHGSQAPAAAPDHVQPSGAPTTEAPAAPPPAETATAATQGATAAPTTQQPPGAPEAPAETGTAAEPATTAAPEPARPPTDIADRNEKPEKSGS
jgi:NADH:ubiquinone oxidoreductase subunit E